MAESVTEAFTLHRTQSDDAGIGVEIRTKSCRPGLTVSHLTQGGPAARGGHIQSGDVIKSINGIDLTSMSCDTALAVIGNVTGDDVHVVVEKAHAREYLGESPGKTIFSSLITKVKNLVVPERVSEETQTSLIEDEQRSSASIDAAIEDDGRRGNIMPGVGEKGFLQVPRKKPSKFSKQRGKDLACVDDVEGYGSDISGDGPLNSTPDIHSGQTNQQTNTNLTEPKPLRFLLDERKNYTDTLHMKAEAVHMNCSHRVCSGSIMSPPQPRPGNSPRPKAELIKQAKQFIHDYYTSIKRIDSEAHKTRWCEVLSSIEKTGTYDLTTAELTFGAKSAWRNAPRCIGRIQWSKLQLFDARNIQTARQMFEAICTHIKYATNKGFLRSAITIFPPRTDGKQDFKIWNPQLIRYCGYRNEDGSVLGDPASVALTELAIKLGWTPPEKRSMFDIIPLLLQANGEDPEIFDIPREIVLEVEITHPRYPRIAELGLRWYVLPAVANMMLDCGGLEFTGAPFSGWYMASEIASRDICEETRLDMLKPIAEKIGLDTTSNASLWKDIAAAEMNAAVLHSFQTQRVTITDHHSAAESFMKHLENEVESRGGCPADWVWVVPPISGSLTPVFHQEMLNYKLLPSYEYQDPEPWKTHKWTNQPSEFPQDPSAKKQLRKIKFKELAKAVKLTAGLMKKAMTKRVKCTILFATETGRSKTFSKQLSELFAHSFDVKVVCMDEYDINELQHESLVLVVASTFANGDPPENGAVMAKSLHEMVDSEKPQSAAAPMEEAKTRTLIKQVSRDKPGSFVPGPVMPDDLSHAALPLANVRFSVFALGSSAYPNFCAFGKFVDTMLGQLGGERIAVCGLGDELHGQEDSFKEWSQQVYKTAQNIEFGKKSDQLSQPPPSPSKDDAGKTTDEDKRDDEAEKADKDTDTEKNGTNPVVEESQDKKTESVPAIVVHDVKTDHDDVKTDHDYCQTADGTSQNKDGMKSGELQQLTEKMCELLEGSDQSSFLEESLEQSGLELDWYDMILREYLLMREAACDAFCLDAAVDDEGAAEALQSGDNTWSADKFRLAVKSSSEKEPDIPTVLSQIHNKKVVLCKIVTCDQLQASGSERRTILCRFDTQGSAHLQYSPGDHLAIFPQQPKCLVDAVLEKVTFSEDTTPDTIVSPEKLELNAELAGTWHGDERLPSTTMRQALAHLLDLTLPPSQTFLKQLVNLAESEEDKEKIKRLAGDSNIYDEWKYDKFPNMQEILEEFPSLTLPATFLLSQLPLLQQRFYSISSSPQLYPGEIHATVAVVTYRTKGGQGVLHEGVCSNWLDRIKMGTLIPCFVRKAPHFHLPKDPAAPLILVGPGTGIAPLRAFWQQRLVELQAIGPQAKSGNGESRHGRMSLYFGCRNANVDNIYREEKREMEKRGVLSEVHLALSREPGIAKKYVQDLLKAHSVRVYHELVEEGGHLYVCGDVSMASDVCNVVEHILMQEGNMTSNAAAGYVMMMRERNRFHEDIFGVTLKTSEIQRSAREQAKLGWKRFADTSKLLVPVANRKYSLPVAVMRMRKSSGGVDCIENNEKRLFPLPMTLRRYSQRPAALSQVHE